MTQPDRVKTLMMEGLLRQQIADDSISSQEYAQLATYVRLAQEQQILMQLISAQSARKSLDQAIWWRNPGDINKVKAYITERETLGAMGSYDPRTRSLSVGGLVDPNEVLAQMGLSAVQPDARFQHAHTEWLYRLLNPEGVEETALHEGLHAVWDIGMDPKHKERFIEEARQQTQDRSKYGPDIQAIADKAPIYAQVAQTAAGGKEWAVEWMANEMFAHRGAALKYDLSDFYTLPKHKELDDIVGSYINWSKRAKRDISPQSNLDKPVMELLASAGISQQAMERALKNWPALMLPAGAGIQFSGFDRTYNTIQGFQEGGTAGQSRKPYGFGSGRIRSVLSSLGGIGLRGFKTGTVFAKENIQATSKIFTKSIIPRAMKGGPLEIATLGITGLELGHLGYKTAKEEATAVNYATAGAGLVLSKYAYLGIRHRKQLMEFGRAFAQNPELRRGIGNVLSGQAKQVGRYITRGEPSAIGRFIDAWGGRKGQQAAAGYLKGQYGHLVSQFPDINQVLPVLRTQTGTTGITPQVIGARLNKTTNQAANIIEGLKHQGEAGRLRHLNTDFGSGWNALKGMVRAGETFAEMIGSDAFQSALRHAGRVKELQKGVGLYKGTFRGEEFQFVRKIAGVGPEELSAMRAIEESVGPHLYRSKVLGKKTPFGDRAGMLEMEYIEGQTLEQVRRGGTAEQLETFRSLSEEAFGTLHRAGYLHQDPHARNVMIVKTKEGYRSALIDLEQSKRLPIQAARREAAIADELAEATWHFNTLKQNPNYMTPIMQPQAPVDPFAVEGQTSLGDILTKLPPVPEGLSSKPSVGKLSRKMHSDWGSPFHGETSRKAIQGAQPSYIELFHQALTDAKSRGYTESYEGALWRKTELQQYKAQQVALMAQTAARPKQLSFSFMNVTPPRDTGRAYRDSVQRWDDFLNQHVSSRQQRASQAAVTLSEADKSWQQYASRQQGQAASAERNALSTMQKTHLLKESKSMQGGRLWKMMMLGAGAAWMLHEVMSSGSEKDKAFGLAEQQRYAVSGIEGRARQKLVASSQDLHTAQRQIWSNAIRGGRRHTNQVHEPIQQLSRFG